MQHFFANFKIAKKPLKLRFYAISGFTYKTYKIILF